MYEVSSGAPFDLTAVGLTAVAVVGGGVEHAGPPVRGDRVVAAPQVPVEERRLEVLQASEELPQLGKESLAELLDPRIALALAELEPQPVSRPELDPIGAPEVRAVGLREGAAAAVEGKPEAVGRPVCRRRGRVQPGEPLAELALGLRVPPTAHANTLLRG